MSDPIRVGRLNEQAKGSVDRALTFEQQLTAVYAGQLRRSARYAADRFRALAPVRLAAVTAAVNPTPPDWSPPDHDELQDEPLNARAAAQAQRIHLQAVTAALPPVLAGRLDELGIAYDVASPFADQVLGKVGTKGVNLGLATRDVIVKVIGQAYSEGWTVPQTAAALQSQIDHLSTTTAVMQARTDLVGLANGSSLAAVQALGDGAPPVKIWLTAGDELVRPSHADAEGQEVPIDQPFQVGDDLLAYPGDPDGSDGETINCFPAGTLVAGTVRAAMRAAYRGTMVTVSTRGGRRLSGTPNHPVLTSSGWKALGAIAEGDYLVCASFEQGSVAGTPDVKDAPSRIEKVFDSLAPDLLRPRVRARYVNFHGDLPDGDVDVVRADGFLELPCTPAGFKPSQKLELAVADVLAGSLSRNGLSSKLRVACGAPSAGSISEPRKSLSLPERHSHQPQAPRLRGATTWDGLMREAILDDSPGNTEICGDHLLRVAVQVSPGDLGAINVSLQDSRVSSGGSHARPDGDRRGLEVDSETGDAHAPVIHLDDVVSVDVQAFHGDVFTLDTEQGYYIANGICVRNCRCTVIYGDTATPSDGQVDEEALAASAVAPDVSTLAMVAVYPRPEEAAALAVDGGQDAETIHCTLVFLGEADSFDHDVLAAAVRGVAESLPALEGIVGGAGHFAEGPDGYPSILMPDVQGLSTLQETLRATLEAAGIVSPSEHGFTPHMTQGYAAKPTVPDVEDLGTPLHFDAISVSYGNVRTDFPLAEPSPSSARPITAVASGTVDTSPESLTAGVTITVDGDDTEVETEAVETPWQAVLCVEGEQTEDGRLLDPGSITWRECPLPLGAMFETPHSYDVAAPIVGRIDRIWRDESDPRLIRGEGFFNTDEAGCKAVELIGNESLRGISVDLMVKAYDLRPADPPVATDSVPDDGDGDEDIDEVMVEIDNTIMAVTDGVIGGATVCPVQAIANATISITASAGGSINVAEPDSLIAAATVQSAPREWFETQEPPGLMPLTVTDDGRVFGHLASWDVCHTAFAEACVRPPRSASRYGYFHVGEVETADGGRVAVGKLMVAKVGRPGKHASLNASRAEASRHYDDNTAVGAYIRVVDGRYGPWAAGVVRPGLADEQLAQLRANPPSGDWRRVNGSLELIAALSVPVPGFPVPRADAALVASGELIEVDALIACSGELVESPAVRRALERAGVVEREGPEPTAAQITAKAARAQGRDALVAAALREP